MTNKKEVVQYFSGQEVLDLQLFAVYLQVNISF